MFKKQINKGLKALYVIFLYMMSLGLMAIMVPKECSKEETKFIDQFQYLTKRDGFKNPVKGQLTFYQTNGPVAGGSVQALSIDHDQTIYAGIFGDGIYKRKPGDEKWEPVKRGLKDPFVLSLMVTQDGMLYAGTIKGGVFRSGDQGKTWSESKSGLTNLEVPTMVEYQKDIYIGTGAGVFKSVDKGRHWIPLNKGMEIMLIKSLFIDQNGTFFAGTGGNGILESVDKGKSWHSNQFKLRDQSGMNENYIRVIAGPSENNLYAGTFGGGVFKSSDGGKNWIQVNTGLKNTSIRSIQIGDDGTIFAGTGEGIFKSINDGQNWSPVNEELADKSVQTMLLTPENTLYIGTADGVYIKKEKELNWELLDRGLSFPVIHSILVDPEKGLFAATDGGGVYRSKDGGFSWFPMNEGLTDNNVKVLIQDETHTLYVGTEEGVYLGDRLRKRWIPLEEGIGKPDINALFIDQNHTLFTGTEKGLFKRNISADHWGKINLPSDVPIKSITGDNHKIYALSNHEIFQYSGNEPVGEPLFFPKNERDLLGVYLKENLYAWNDQEIFEGKNLNADVQWNRLSRLPPGLICQTLLVEKMGGKEFIFVGTGKGFLWSQDHGKTWNQGAGKGLFADVRSIVSPYPGTLLIGSGDQGVLVGLGL